MQDVHPEPPSPERPDPSSQPSSAESARAEGDAQAGKIEVEAEPSNATDAGRVYEAPPNPFRAPGESGAAGGSSRASEASNATGSDLYAKFATIALPVLCHVAGFADFGFKFFAAGILLTLVVWLCARGVSPEADFHGKESLNFQLNLLFWQVVAIPLVFCIIGIPMLILLPVAQFIFLLIGAYHASCGERWSYPLVYRIVR